jgi:hypothetical protein
LRTGELATKATFEHGEKAHLCIDCQADVRASAEGKIAAGD